MNHKRSALFLLVLIALFHAAAALATPVGSAFTYQGELELNGVPANGTYDFMFALFNAASGGTQVGSTYVTTTAVQTGLFTTDLDFGTTPFDGTALWIDIQVRPTGSGTFTSLTPRQRIAPTPYALYALGGPGGGGSQWISNGPDLTYSSGGVGILGASSPFASGKGVFLEGGNASYANIFAFNYDNFAPVSLALNAPGGAVGVGTTSPGARLDVSGGISGMGLRATVSGNYVNTTNAAILGYGNTGVGPGGKSAVGVWGQSTDDSGIYGQSTNWIGIYGISQNHDGTWGYSSGAGKSGVVGISANSSGNGGYFRNDAGGTALYADGLAKVKTIQILGGADLAERFECREAAEPGTVMAIDASAPGRVCVAREPYSRTVAGVVSGAHDLAAGVTLSSSTETAGTIALAMSGRVWVRCDAESGAIRAGDLLTTAARPGYAMRVGDHDRAQGAILGKAMTSLEHGTGLVLVLVSLQ